MRFARHCLITLSLLFSSLALSQPASVQAPLQGGAGQGGAGSAAASASETAVPVPPPPAASSLGAGSEPRSSPVTTGVQQPELRDLARIRALGELRVGVYLLTPYVMEAPSGGLLGSEIDIANRIAKDLGVKPVFRLYDWDSLIPALQQGEIDIIVSGLTVTPQRALQLWFSDPYSSSGVALATNIQLTRDFGSLTDLDNPDVAIGVLADTVSEQVATNLFQQASIKRFTDEAKAEEALVKGNLHAYVRSEPAPRFLALRHPKEVDVPLSRPLMATREAFGVRRGDADFINFLNAWVVAREADAWLASTHQYWFESLSWQKQVAQ